MRVVGGIGLICLMLLFGCSGGTQPLSSQTQALAVAVSVASSGPTITFQPSDKVLLPGQTATLSVIATGAAPLSYQWQKNGMAIQGATTPVYVTAAAVAGDAAASYVVAVTDSTGQRLSNYAWVSVSAATPVAGVDVVTYKYDVSRSGQNTAETILSPGSLSPSTFGLLGTVGLDGIVFAQPLYVSHLVIGGVTHNTAFLATENDSVYAIDVDSGAILWQASLIGTGEAASDNRGCKFLGSQVGVTATPVIDRSAGGTGVIYVVGMTVEVGTSSYHQRLHALDLATGAELLNGPTEISATYPTADGAGTVFNPAQYQERAALLLANGTVYTTWTSFCDTPPYSGWIIGYSQTTLTQNVVLDVGPNSGELGPAIWMSGSGPAADALGNIFLITANGVFDSTLDSNGFPSQQDFGNSFLRLAPATGTMTVSDYFAIWNQTASNAADRDLGSGGAMLLPDMTDASKTTRHLIIGAGKDGNIYLVDRDSMGKFNASSNQIWQQLTGALNGVWGSPAYFNGSIYYGGNSETVKAFALSNAKLLTPAKSQTPESFAYPGTSPSISANGSTNGILWAYEYSDPAVLHAYDATNLAHELYDSGTRDAFGGSSHFQPPVVADGKVYLGTASGLAVFGYIHPGGVTAH